MSSFLVSATTFSPLLSDLPPVIGTIVSTAREFQLRTIPTGSFLTGPTQPRLISLVVSESWRVGTKNFPCSPMDQADARSLSGHARFIVGQRVTGLLWMHNVDNNEVHPLAIDLPDLTVGNETVKLISLHLRNSFFRTDFIRADRRLAGGKPRTLPPGFGLEPVPLAAQAAW
jgi:hypothetical protein